MQHIDMVGIRDVVEVLKPVARDDYRPASNDTESIGFDKLPLVHLLETSVSRQHGFTIRGTHVSEDQAVAFLQRVPGLADLVPVARAGGLAGLVKAPSLDIEQPAMITAANAAFVYLAVIQRSASMRTPGIDQPWSTALIAKQDKIFAENPDGSWCVGSIG